MTRHQIVGLSLYVAMMLFYAWLAGKGLDWVIDGHWYAAPFSIVCIFMWAFMGHLLNLLEAHEVDSQ